MQLVEEGRVDLDADVNTYLRSFRIPATFPEPITLRHLLTHTAGFQEGILGYFIGNDSVNIGTIGETVSGHVPRRVRPPGTLASYSNYGAALAGFIVEQVSGEPFAAYIERHIYEPLGIRYATFREPIPASLRPDAVIGYARENGAWVPQPFEINGGWTPAGGTVMSAVEAAKFMLAHLNGGRHGDGRILAPETASLMHRTAFAPAEGLPGMALGFYEERIAGRRLLAHGGDSFWFHTDLHLDLEAGLGVFVSYATGPRGSPRDALVRAIVERYLGPAVPATGEASAAADDAEAASDGDLDRYAGRYRLVRMNYTDLDKLIYLFAPTTIDVSPLPNGRLFVAGALDGPGGELLVERVGLHRFGEVGGDREIGFGERNGRITHLFPGPTTAAERLPWYESSRFWFPALALAALVLLAAAIETGYRRREIRALPAPERRAARLAPLAALWLAVTLVASAGVVAAYGSSLAERIPLALKLVLVLPIGFAALTAVLVGSAVLTWRRGYWSAGRRVGFSLVALAALVVTWFSVQWNVLGWQFG